MGPQDQRTRGPREGIPGAIGNLSFCGKGIFSSTIQKFPVFTFNHTDC